MESSCTRRVLWVRVPSSPPLAEASDNGIPPDSRSGTAERLWGFDSSRFRLLRSNMDTEWVDYVNRVTDTSDLAGDYERYKKLGYYDRMKCQHCGYEMARYLHPCQVECRETKKEAILKKI